MQNLRELAGAIQNDRETLINIIMVVLFILYVWAFYTIILKRDIADALESNNKSLGTNSLKQLSQEIVAKEKTLVLKTKENQRATIVSVVGLILTILFGLLSIVPK